MSNSTTVLGFSSIDYKGENSLSSYTLPITPLIFISDEILEDFRSIVWDFGDGTISKSISSSKFYELPGKYTVNLIVYDCNSNALISTESKVVTIYDYIPHTFTVEYDNYILSEDGEILLSEDGEYILSEDTDISFKSSVIEGPIKVTSFYPTYQPKTAIYYDILGSNSSNLWNIDNKYYHLMKFHSLYEKIFNYRSKTSEYVQISNINFETSPIYGKISNNNIVLCDKNDEDSTVLGLSGYKYVYFKDDNVTDQVLLKLWFDKTNIQLGGEGSVVNNTNITLSASVINNTPHRLSITSNGIDGEFYPISSFEIANKKFENVDIPFLVKVKDDNNHSIKNVSLSNVYITVLSGNSPLDNTYYNLSNITYTLSSLNEEGFYRGSVKFYNLPYSLTDISLSATCLAVDLYGNYPLYNTSNKFNVLKRDINDIWKKNEDFSPRQTIKDITFQETMIDKIKFHDFIEYILGEQNHEGVGVKYYEKIANFVSNNKDIEISTIDGLDSEGKLVNYDNVLDDNYIFPESIKYIIEAASIQKHKLLGKTNEFTENFDIKGRSNKSEYGRNLGDEIDTLSYVVSADNPIVALEKFSNKYTLLNTNQPISATGAEYYPLSTYANDWGWPLVMPSTYIPQDIYKYYKFFSYIDQPDASIVGSLVDFDNINTNISQNSTNEELRDIFDTLILDNIYSSVLID